MDFLTIREKDLKEIQKHYEKTNDVKIFEQLMGISIVLGKIDVFKYFKEKCKGKYNKRKVVENIYYASCLKLDFESPAQIEHDEFNEYTCEYLLERYKDELN